MRLTTKQVQNRLDWSVLDVEQEEWDRRMADLGVAAAANGFPFHPPAGHPGHMAKRVRRQAATCDSCGSAGTLCLLLWLWSFWLR